FCTWAVTTPTRTVKERRKNSSFLIALCLRKRRKLVLMNNQDETQDERLLLMSHPTVTFVTHSCAARIVLPAQRNCQDEFEARQWFTRQEPRELLFARLLPT